ncbi:hypothetical protein [Sphingomonas sp.]|uniref:hypothetical protein n=1 Tax=Sphingomonas sp. TaxID=28214 RepID=UPI003B3B046A
MGEPENPPAFPQQCADALDVGMVHEGMSLRDWFAGQAMSHALSATASHDGCYNFEAAAHGAYEMADCMLAERASGIAAEPQPDAAAVARWREQGIANHVNGTCTSCEKPAADCWCVPF